MGGPRLAIVIPAYREAASIGNVVSRATAHGAVIVIDDGSPDDTGRIAAEAGATVFRNEPNRGYDETIERGFVEADRLGFTHVVTMDADGEHDPATLAEYKKLLIDQGIPLVLGVRPGKQRLSEVVMGGYVRARFGAHDILCGMKGYDLDLWRGNGRAFDRDGGIGTELALNAMLRGAKFHEVAVPGAKRQDAPRFDQSLRANLRIFAALAKLIRRERAVAKGIGVHA